jgi:hypothetical protein
LALSQISTPIYDLLHGYLCYANRKNPKQATCVNLENYDLRTKFLVDYKKDIWIEKPPGKWCSRGVNRPWGSDIDCDESFDKISPWSDKRPLKSEVKVIQIADRGILTYSGDDIHFANFDLRPEYRINIPKDFREFVTKNKINRFLTATEKMLCAVSDHRLKCIDGLDVSFTSQIEGVVAGNEKSSRLSIICAKGDSKVQCWSKGERLSCPRLDNYLATHNVSIPNTIQWGYYSSIQMIDNERKQPFVPRWGPCYEDFDFKGEAF